MTEAGTGQRRKLRIPVLGAAARGFVAYLVLEAIDGAKRELVQHPDTALQAYGPTLLATLHTEWERRGKHSVRWSLMIPESAGAMPLDGDSLGAAAAVGFNLLGDRRPYDAGCTVTARVTQGESTDVLLHSVGEERKKLEAALAAGLKRVGVATDTDLSATEIADFRNRGLEVKKLATLVEAMDFASGLATGLRDYFDLLIARPDEEGKRPAYLGGRKPTALYIEPDVLKRERREGSREVERDGRSDGTERLGQREGENERREVMPREALDIGEEAVYGQRPQDEKVEKREEWKREVEEMRRGALRAGVVLGPPGQGKSVMMEMTLRELAQEARERLETTGSRIDEVLLPAGLSFEELAGKGEREGKNAEEGLREALGKKLREMGCQLVASEYIEQHAHEARAWIFLDALDELPSGDEKVAKVMAEYLGVLAKWQCRVVMASRPYAYGKWQMPFAVGTVREYRLAPLREEQGSEFIGKWYERDHGRKRKLEELWRRSTSVRQVGQNPFLLTLVCWVGERHELSEEVRRTELYDRAVPDLLGLEVKGKGEVDTLRGEELLPMMAEVGLGVFQETKGKRGIESGRLLELLRSSEQRPYPAGVEAAGIPLPTPMQQAHSFLKELSEKRVLLALTKDGAAYAFPHRSILEYLAAWELAKQLEVRTTTGEQEAKRTWKLIDKKAWDPDWEHVIVLLAGKLCSRVEDLQRVLQLLSDEQTDDLFCHRLALAVQCLGEVASGSREAAKTEIELITRRAFSLWWCYHQGDGKIRLASRLDIMAWRAFHWGLIPLIGHVVRTLPVLGLLNCNLLGVPLTTFLSDFLADENGVVRLWAVAALAEWGSVGSIQTIWSRLCRMLEDSDVFIRSMAVWALGDLGSASASAPLVQRVVDLLDHNDVAVRCAAVAVLGAIGTAAGSTKTIDRLGVLIRSSHSALRYEGAKALGMFGEAAARPEILAQLCDLLRDQDDEIRKEAAKALGKLLRATPRLEILAQLADFLRDPEPRVRIAALSAIEEMGSTPLISAILVDIVDQLSHSDPAVQSGALKALWTLGVRGATPGQLIELMIHRDRATTVMAAQMFSRFWNDSPEMDAVLAGLNSILLEEDQKTCVAAASTLQSLGRLEVTQEILDRLSEVLRNESWGARIDAMDLLADLGPAVAVSSIRSRLGELLMADDLITRHSAGKVLQSMGEAAATHELIARVKEVFRYGIRASREKATIGAKLDSNGEIDVQADFYDMCLGGCKCDVWETASKVLHAMGQAVTTEDLLDELAETLADEHGNIRKTAADAVRELGLCAATPTILARLLSMGGGNFYALEASAKALADMMSRGIRIFKRDEETEYQSVSELSI